MKSDTKFDERQILERGKAFKYGFFSALITILVMFIITECFEVKTITSELSLYICMWVPITVCTLTLIIKDAYEAINQSSGRLIFSIFGICSIFILVISVVHMITRKSFVMEIPHLFIVICMISISTTYWVKQFINKKRFQS